MLDLSGLNYWAIAVATLLQVALGAFWYSPAGFGKKWSKMTGVDMMKLPQNEANRAIGSVALGVLVQVAVLAVVLNTLGIKNFWDGALVGVVLWLGFTGATTIGNSLYARWGWKFWWLNNSFYLIVSAVNAGILAVWK